MAAREGNIAWVAAMMRVMVQVRVNGEGAVKVAEVLNTMSQVLEQMRCSRAVEQDNFTYYSVSRVEVPVPQVWDALVMYGIICYRLILSHLS